MMDTLRKLKFCSPLKVKAFWFSFDPIMLMVPISKPGNLSGTNM